MKKRIGEEGICQEGIYYYGWKIEEEEKKNGDGGC
jgi:hypothetical protein